MKRLQPKDPYFNAVNPKDLVAQTKLDLSVIPETAIIAEAAAWYEGALKYGRFNYRMRPVKLSVYYSALMRHLLKFHAGKDDDTATFVAHLGYIRCCAGIMIDAMFHGSLIDDRPPRGRLNPDIESVLDKDMVKLVKHLQKLFKSSSPKQYTIKDVFGKELPEPKTKVKAKRKAKAKKK